MYKYWRAMRAWVSTASTNSTGRKAVIIAAIALLTFSALTIAATPSVKAATQLYSDDFEADALGAVPAGWTPVSGSGWSVQLDGSHVLAQTSTSTATTYEITAGSTAWTDYTFQVAVKPGANDLSQATVVMGRYVDTNNHYSFLLKNHSEWYLGKKINGIWTTLAQGSYSYTSAFYTLALTMQGSTISCSLNGVTLATRTDTALSHGQIGVSTKATSEFDNVLVTSGAAPTPTPTPTPTNTPTPTPSPSPTPPPSGGPAAQLSVTTSSSGVTVQSEDANLNGWRIFFKKSAGGVITNDGELDQGVYTELEAQNVSHGRIQMYFQTSGGVWVGNLSSAGTVTVLRDTPGLVELQVVSTNTSYQIQWITTYFIWPDGEMYVQLQATNIGSTALALASSDSLEIDLGGLALTYYQDTSPYAWYLNGGVATSPIPTSVKNVEAQLFGHMTTVAPPPDMGVLLDKYTTWSAQGASSAGIAEAQNTSRAKDKWLGNLARVTPGQTLSFMFLFDQRRYLTQAQSIAMDKDFRTPSIAVSVGTLASSDNEPAGATVINGFNMNLGAYVVAADYNHVNATLAFPSGVTTRFAPRFKITGWTDAAPTITWGGQSLTNGADYTYTIDSTTHTLYVQLTFDVVAANAQTGQRVNAALDIS